MKCIIDNEEYNVEIVKKSIKNVYIRVKEDLTIYVTINYLASKHQVYKLLENNEEQIKKMIKKQQNHQSLNMDNYFLGGKYDIIHIDNFNDIDIDNKKIYLDNIEELDKLYRKKAEEIFNDRLRVMYNRFEEKINYPKLRIRTMKTRWGVCNRKSKTITLNLNLIKYDLEKIDYVIVHELCHFVHFDHSFNFWLLVSKYIPNYKKIRKELRD